jgi:hypothetical protein
VPQQEGSKERYIQLKLTMMQVTFLILINNCNYQTMAAGNPTSVMAVNGTMHRLSYLPHVLQILADLHTLH